MSVSKVHNNNNTFHKNNKNTTKQNKGLYFFKLTTCKSKRHSHAMWAAPG